MAKTNPLQFIQQVRAEVAKVVWPNRREVALTTLMVFLLAAFMAIFLSLVDLLIRFGLEGVLNTFGCCAPLFFRAGRDRPARTE